MSLQRSAPLHGVKIHGHDGAGAAAPVQPVGNEQQHQTLAQWEKLLAKRAGHIGAQPLPKAVPEDALHSLFGKDQPEPEAPLPPPTPTSLPLAPPPPASTGTPQSGADVTKLQSDKGSSEAQESELTYVAVGPRRAPSLHGGSDSGPETSKGDDGSLRTGETQGVELDLRATQTLNKLVDSVKGFCNDPAAQHGEGWTMRMELNPSILPDTDLELNLSQQWLLLRFQARDNWSRTLISQETPLLERMLTDTLNPKRLVSVQLD